MITVGRDVLAELYAVRSVLLRQRRLGQISEANQLFLSEIEKEINVRERCMTEERRAADGETWAKLAKLAEHVLEVQAQIERVAASTWGPP